MKKLLGWLFLGALALIPAACSNSDSAPATTSNAFPSGLSTASSQIDFNQDGVNEEIDTGRFSYDAAGRVVGYEATYQYDNDSDGIVDSGQRLVFTFDPTLPFHEEDLTLHIKSVNANVVPSVSRRPGGEELLYQLATLTKVVPVAMSEESYALPGVTPFSLAEQLVLDRRTTITYRYDRQGRMVGSVYRDESGEGVLQETWATSFNAAGDITEESYLDENFDPGSNSPSSSSMEKYTYSYDAQGNLTQTVNTYDVGNDGFYEDQSVLNDANEYNADGQLMRVVETDSTSPVVVTRTYTYDEAGNLSREIWERQLVADGPVVRRDQTDYTYDAAGQLLTEVTAWDNYDAVNGLSQTDGIMDYRRQGDWSYDAAGKMLSEDWQYDTNADGTWDSAWATRWSYDEAGRLFEVQDLDGVPLALNESRGYQYDGTGRLVGQALTRPGWGTQTTTLTFDADDRLLSLVVGFVSDVVQPALVTPSGWSHGTTFSYDEAGQINGYVYENDTNGDGVAETRDEATVTVDGLSVRTVIKSYVYDSAQQVYNLTSEQAFDMNFLNALPTGSMEIPGFDQDQVPALLPKLQAFLLYFRDFVNGMRG